MELMAQRAQGRRVDWPLVEKIPPGRVDPQDDVTGIVRMVAYVDGSRRFRAEPIEKSGSDDHEDDEQDQHYIYHGSYVRCELNGRPHEGSWYEDAS
jgi:hypothetical protein